VPNVPEAYVHRIGRTARAGAGGSAITLCDPAERAFVRDIERAIRMPIPVVTDHPFAAGGIAPPPPARAHGHARPHGGGHHPGRPPRHGGAPHRVGGHRPEGSPGARSADGQGAPARSAHGHALPARSAYGHGSAARPFAQAGVKRKARLGRRERARRKEQRRPPG